MPLNPRSRPPVGQQRVTPARGRKGNSAPVPASSATPTRTPTPTPATVLGRNPVTPQAAAEPDAVMQQAKRDIDAGLVDTDMRATPGLDAALRNKLVPGAGGKPTAVKR